MFLRPKNIKFFLRDKVVNFSLATSLCVSLIGLTLQTDSAPDWPSHFPVRPSTGHIITVLLAALTKEN